METGQVHNAIAKATQTIESILSDRQDEGESPTESSGSSPDEPAWHQSSHFLQDRVAPINSEVISNASSNLLVLATSYYPGGRDRSLEKDRMSVPREMEAGGQQHGMAKPSFRQLVSRVGAPLRHRPIPDGENS